MSGGEKPGKRFEGKFRESLPEGVFSLRIPDARTFYGARAAMSESEADFVVATGTHTCLVECKAVNRPRLEFHNVKGHQERSLMEFDSLGPNTHGILAVEFYDKRGYRNPKRMFLMPIAAWMRFREETDRASMPVSEFEASGLEVPYMGSRYAIEAWMLEGGERGIHGEG